jgi:hypothetical protein
MCRSTTSSKKPHSSIIASSSNNNSKAARGRAAFSFVQGGAIRRKLPLIQGLRLSERGAHDPLARILILIKEGEGNVVVH